MKPLFLLINVLLFVPYLASAQADGTYSDWISKANSFYEAKQYKQSADAYSKAFAANGGKGFLEDRYNAACVWALADNKDSAFYQLDRIATKANFTDYDHLLEDSDLESLHKDNRWKTLCAYVKRNKEKAEAHIDKKLAAILDTIFKNDQGNRIKMDEVANKYGQNSKEMEDLWKEQTYLDSVDLVKVTNILDKYGWVGADIVGGRGNETIFLVIQHADIKTQQKYLPAMRDAIKNRKADAGSLALLEDRVALREGRKQIYGRQIHGSPDGKYWISPIEDPDNVDKRRAEVGLQPLADYVKHWNIKWDVAEYKKQLPEIEKKDKW